MHLLYSQDAFLLNKTLNKLIKSLNDGGDFEVINYSLINDPIDDIFEDCNSYSIFETKKIIIINDAWFLTERKINLHKSFSVEKLMNLLEVKNPDNKLIFTLNTEKISQKLKITKWFIEHVEINEIKILSEDTTKKYIKHFFMNANKDISDELIDFIYVSVPNADMQLINNEIEKLVNLDCLQYTKDIIQNVLTPFIENDIFKLVEQFVRDDIDNFVLNLSNFLNINDNFFGLITLMLAQLVFIRNIIHLKSEDLSESMISDKLQAHPYRVKINYKNNFQLSQLNDKIKVLYKIQNKLLLSESDDKIIPEYELLKALKRR